MMDLLIFVLLVAVGFVLGNVINQIMEKLYEKKFMGEQVPSVIVEIMYFTLLFSVPMSGNIAIFILVTAILLYTLYGRFGAGKLKPGKPEDGVHTKWYTGYP